MTQWVVTTDHPTLSQGLGEFLAGRVPGQWTERKNGHLAEYALTATDLSRSDVGRTLAEALAEFLLVYHEHNWIAELLSGRYRVFEEREQRSILDQVVKIVHHDGSVDRARMSQAVRAIYGFLHSNAYVILEGIRTFLWPNIRLEMQEAIDQAIDAYLLEQEYQEFVMLLKQLVDVAGTQHEWIHVRFRGKQFYFEDSAGRQIADDLVDDMLIGVDEEYGRIDDVLISALVTLAPERITVHQGHLSREGRETLIQVFENKILFCGGCARCFSNRRHADRDW